MGCCKAYTLAALLLLCFAGAAFGKVGLSSPLRKGGMEKADSSSSKPFPSMLEISTRPWLYSLSQKYGRNISRLVDIPPQEFAAIRDDGYQVVWMMGIWSLGSYGLRFDQTNPSLLSYYPTVLPDYTQADIIGSPYAPTRYITNPVLGTDADVLALKKALNALGLKLMLDFVPNHSAVDADWTMSHPEYYVRAPQGSHPPYDPNTYYTNGIAYGSAGWGGPWMDTSQYNYWNPDFIEAQLQNVLHIASMADYIRCDMAYLVLNENVKQNWGSQILSWGYKAPSREFWDVAISLAKSKYDVKFLAEVYNPWQSTLQAWFDFTYDKQLYDRLVDGNLDNIRGYISGNSIQYHSKNAHFVENHDEPRAAAEFGSPYRADAAALVSFTLPGMRFLFEGQTRGYHNRLDVHLRRAASEPTVTYTQQYYKTLLQILTRDAFHSGQWEFLNVLTGNDNPITNWRLMAWKWVGSSEKILCVINYSDTPGEGRIVLSDAGSTGAANVTLTDLLSTNTYQRSASDLKSSGLYVIVNQWWGQIFTYN